MRTLLTLIRTGQNYTPRVCFGIWKGAVWCSWFDQREQCQGESLGASISLALTSTVSLEVLGALKIRNLKFSSAFFRSRKFSVNKCKMADGGSPVAASSPVASTGACIVTGHAAHRPLGLLVACCRTPHPLQILSQRYFAQTRLLLSTRCRRHQAPKKTWLQVNVSLVLDLWHIRRSNCAQSKAKLPQRKLPRRNRQRVTAARLAQWTPWQMRTIK